MYDGQMTVDLLGELVAEALGTALLLAVVVGSGIMGERLAGGNDAIALLGNMVATGAALVVLIWFSGRSPAPTSNPAVTLAFWMRRGTRAGGCGLLRIGPACRWPDWRDGGACDVWRTALG